MRPTSGLTLSLPLSPSYFVPADLATVVECAKEVASSSSGLGFFYYRIPSMTGVAPNVPELIDRSLAEFPSFAGVKFSDTLVHDLTVRR